jgi:transposase-like protein
MPCIQQGQFIDAYGSTRRTAQAGSPLGEACFVRAMTETGVRPTRVTTDTATCYPAALHIVLPAVEQRRSRTLNTGIERNHGHLTHRLRPMRGGTQVRSIACVARGHALTQNLRTAVSTLTSHLPATLRRAEAWPECGAGNRALLGTA